MRNRRPRKSLPSPARSRSTRFKSSTTPRPNRRVNFTSVVGCGGPLCKPMRQNRRHDKESETPLHSDSYPKPWRCFKYMSRR